MERLRQSDLDRVRAFLAETSLPCDLETFSSRLLPAFQSLVPGDVVCLSETDEALQRSVTWEVYPYGAHMDVELFDLYMFDHPVFQHWELISDSPAAFTSALVPMAQWHRSNLYQAVYRPLGLEDSLAIGLPAPRGLVSCICIERRRCFSDRDRALMEMVRPYVAQLYRNAETMSLISQSTGGIPAHSIVLDHDWHPLVAAQEARELMGRYCPEAHTDTAFSPHVAAWLHGQLARFTHDHEIPAPASALTLRGQEGGTLTLRLLPGLRTDQQALLLMHERRPPSDAIAPRLGLSGREKEVLVLARRGLRSVEIADRLGISRRTVEKHFDNIFCKLGVANRTAAIATAFQYAE